MLSKFAEPFSGITRDRMLPGSQRMESDWRGVKGEGPQQAHSHLEMEGRRRGNLNQSVSESHNSCMISWPLPRHRHRHAQLVQAASLPVQTFRTATRFSGRAAFAGRLTAQAAPFRHPKLACRCSAKPLPLALERLAARRPRPCLGELAASHG